jgi:hypothetical protein
LCDRRLTKPGASLKIPRSRADHTWNMRQNAGQSSGEYNRTPQKGDRIELLQPRTGVRCRGTVFYVDQMQILVKWDDGRSESLRPRVDLFRIIEAA